MQAFVPGQWPAQLSTPAHWPLATQQHTHPWSPGSLHLTGSVQSNADCQREDLVQLLSLPAWGDMQTDRAGGDSRRVYLFNAPSFLFCAVLLLYFLLLLIQEELFSAGKFTWVSSIVVIVFYKGFISEIENVQKHYCYGASLFDHVPLFNNSFRSDNTFFIKIHLASLIWRHGVGDIVGVKLKIWSRGVGDCIYGCSPAGGLSWGLLCIWRLLELGGDVQR